MESLESLQNQYRKEAASLITDVGKIAQESGLADLAAMSNLEDVLTGITLLVINAGMSLEQVEDVVAELETEGAPTPQEVYDAAEETLSKVSPESPIARWAKRVKGVAKDAMNNKIPKLKELDWLTGMGEAMLNGNQEDSRILAAAFAKIINKK